MSALGTSFVSERAMKIPESGVRVMFRIAQRLKDVVNLSLGEPDFETPPHIVAAAVRAMKEGYTHYTPNAGLIEFREAAAEKLRRENKIHADPETEIMATVGSMGALSLAVLTVVNPGEEVLVKSGFASYEAQVLMAGGRPVSYRLIEEKEFQPDVEELSRLVTSRTKAILLNSPSNPTGSVLSERTIKEIAELAVEQNLIIISDEAYERILYDDAQHLSVASLPGMKDLTISVFSLSKTYAMTGWRIGYAVSSREIISEMTKLQEHLAAHPSSISQMAAVAALTGPDDYVETMVKEYVERRNLVMRELSRVPGLRCVKPMGAFYVFPNISDFGVSSRDFAMHLLKEAKVVVVPGTAFGRFGEGHIRISYSVSEENLLKALSRIGEALERVST